MTSDQATSLWSVVLEELAADDPHQRFWEGLRRVHTDTIEGGEGVIGAAERAIANSEASAANAAVHAKAAKELVERIERGETVKSGLGNPLTRKES